MQIAITGTRGIPNTYGGFERFAEKLSSMLAGRGHEVQVYCPACKATQARLLEGVQLVYEKLPEKSFGSAANFLYDRASIREACQRNVDIILECGYASAAPWYPFLRKANTKLITHMDGMEWQRAKWNKPTRMLIRKTERMAVKHSDMLICDSPLIADYYKDNYGVDTEMVPYGADVLPEWNESYLDDYHLNPNGYYLLVSRLEPENNIRMIVDGFLRSNSGEPLLIVGHKGTKHGRKIVAQYADNENIRFIGGIFRHVKLYNLRHFAIASFHGHSVGGTNPSLLEAMAASSPVIAHDNPYNKWVLGDNADYFSDETGIRKVLETFNKEVKQERINKNLQRIHSEFNWEKVTDQYESLFTKLKETSK